jgi:hypothetical protein
MILAPKRRWFAFSLRTLLLVVLLVGTLAGLGIRELLRRQEDELDRQQTQQALKDAWLRNDREKSRPQRLSR